jgi:hypothetical protein
MSEQINQEGIAADCQELQKLMYDYYCGYMFGGRSLDELRNLVTRCNDLVADRENDEVTFEALTVMLQFAEDLPAGESLRVWSRAAKRLTDGYINDPKICRILEDRSILPPMLRLKADEVMESILCDSENAEVVANCKYARVSDFMVREQYCGGLTPEERRTAVQALRELSDVHGAVKNANPRLHFGATLGEVAQSDIYELENLHVGAVAPEIEGTDMEGLPMRLSDYRGKVVFLKFWGDW